MKRFRIIASLLVFMLTCSPVLAAVCATTCAASEHMAATMTDQVQAADHHCHSSEKHSRTTGEHKGCSMAGCHFTQFAPLSDSSDHSYAHARDSHTLVLKQVAVSTDPYPPIKPPA